jgi:Cu2+-exporting ATPase
LSTALSPAWVAPAPRPVDTLHCRHCGAPMEGTTGGEAAAAYCCGGCEAAAAIIAGAGLDAYYALRTAAAPRPEPQLGAWERLPVTGEGDRCVVRFAVDGTRCASCTWVIEQVLARTPGVAHAHVSYATGRAAVVFDPAQVPVAEVARRVVALGYSVRPAEAAAREVDRDLLVRLGVSAFASMNLMLLAASVYAGWADGMDEKYLVLHRWTMFALATPVATWCAEPFVRGAIVGLRHRVLGLDVPVALGVGVLYAQGAWATVTGHEAWFDSLGMLVTLLLGGRLLEARGRRRAQEAAERLSSNLPRTVRRWNGTGLDDVPLDEIRLGDRLPLGAGVEVPVDGTVDEGQGSVRMALVTGESEPVPVGPGAALVAGAVVVDGAFTVRATAVGGETLMERMAAELRQATDREAVVSGPGDRIAPWFTAATLVVAATTFGVLAGTADLGTATERTVAVLIVACPCALALAQPLAIAAGLGAAARRGLLVRSGASLLDLGQVERVALDKTGTLTTGAPSVVSAADDALRWAAGVERYSVHPVARAIVAEATARGIPLPAAHDVVEIAGRGIRGVVGGRAVSVSAGQAEGVAVTVDGEPVGCIVVRDALRPDARRAVAALSALVARVDLLTGDRPEVAVRIGAEAGISAVDAGVDPLGKAAWVRAREAAGERVLFVGDGLNDGPALVAARVGVAMGSGVATAIVAADAVVPHPSLAPVVAGIRIGRATHAVMRGNFARSLVYNVVAVGAAAAGWVNPLVAAILMPVSSLLVVWGASTVERRVRRIEEDSVWKG